MATTLRADHIEHLAALEDQREARTSDPRQLAWHAVDLARAIRDDHAASPTAEAFGVLWLLLGIAESCDGRLAASGRTSADNNGDRASAHVRLCLDRMAVHSLRDAIPT